MTTFKGVKDLALTTIADSGDLNNTTNPVTFNVAAGTGAEFPASGSFWITVWDKATYPDPNDDPNREVMLVTSRSTDDLTATRGQLGTSNQVHTGTPFVGLLWHSQHVDDITGAIGTLENRLPASATGSDTSTVIGISGTFALDIALGTGKTGAFFWLSTAGATTGFSGVPYGVGIATTISTDAKVLVGNAMFSGNTHLSGGIFELGGGGNVYLQSAVYNSGTGNLTLTFKNNSGAASKTLNVYYTAMGL